MTPHWLAVLGCLCLTITTGHSAAVPTQDTMVVSRSDYASTTESTTLTTPEPVTEGPTPPIKLTEMNVRSDVSLRYAHTTVVAHVRNPARRAQEATFRVLLPETAFISGFVMTLDGKSYKAYVKEKEEAKNIYQQAVSQGIGAAHIATKARDSNHFTVSVNVEASSSAIFNLTYEELLVRRNGVYNHAINLHPGALVPKLTVTVHIKETQKITDLRVPEIRTGNEVDATKDDALNSKAIIERGHDDREATITFTPDLEEQKRLIAIYAEKSKESAAHRVNRWYNNDNEEKDIDGVLGQFVVQYDVDRSKDEEILVNDGYFVHFCAPSTLPPLSKYVVFVLDTSGSMMDRKIIQLREAMQTILSDLNEGDYFSIVEFASSVQVHDLKEADLEPPKRQYYYGGESEKPATLVPPSPATPENIAKAKVIVSRLDAYGGTNIDDALDIAVKLVQKGVGWTQSSNVSDATTPTPSTTVAVTTEKKEAQTELSVAEKEKVKQLEPIIIFLTDGDPTIGETRPNIIINHLTEKNYGDKKATIFSLAFGEDADRSFLRKVSLRNDGFMRHIYEAADAALQLRDFYKQVSSPLLADVKFTYPSEQVKAESLTKRKFRTFYAGSELVVAGRIEETATELTPQISAFCGVIDDPANKYGRKRYENKPKVPVVRETNKYLPLERVWAYLTIKQKLDERDSRLDSDADSSTDKDKTPEKIALDIALKYSFVTPLTSLVVVKPNATNAVNAESVDKQDSQLEFDSPGPLAFGSPQSISFARPMASYASAGFYGLPGAPSPNGFSALSIGTQYRTDNLLVRSRPAYFSVGGKFASNSLKHRDILTTTIPSSFLGVYHLQDYSWTEQWLSLQDDSLKIPVNGTDVLLKLTRATDVPKKAGGDEKCAKSLDGNEGVCVYLTRCDAAKTITMDLYYPTYNCTVNEGYAGVCCPETKVDAN